MGWFGNLDLAWKYGLVLGIALALTLIAGIIKVVYDRKKVRDHRKKMDAEAAGKDDQVELNAREKDEGDLFGIRALEAGFYGGVAQSRPTSAAGSYKSTSQTPPMSQTPSMSTNTLIGSNMSPKLGGDSLSGSVSSLALRTDSPDVSGSPPKHERKVPPTIKLRPSEAELSGRINHGGSNAVDMNLQVPPSPAGQIPHSPAFSFVSSESDNSPRHSPHSLSPRSPTFPSKDDPSKPQTYMPRIPTPEGISVREVPSPDDPMSRVQSQAGSIHSGAAESPNHSGPPSPRLPPPVKVPSSYRPARDEQRTLFPASLDVPKSRSSSNSKDRAREQSTSEASTSGSSPQKPEAHEPTIKHSHQLSSGSSTYSLSHTRQSSDDRPLSRASRSYSFSQPLSTPPSPPRVNNPPQIPESPEPPTWPSMAIASDSYSLSSRRPSNASSKSFASSLTPASILTSSSQNNSNNDPRFSEFFDAYYRHSQIATAQKAEAPAKRPAQLSIMKQPTIEEVPSPLSSPWPPLRSPKCTQGTVF